MNEKDGFDARGNNMADSEKILRALSDGNRLNIVSAIAKSEKICAHDLLEGLDITQPTLSHHMKVLADSGIVDTVKDGRRRYYAIDREVAAEFLESMGKLLDIGD